MGKIYLVGAGPGNSKLITIRGVELLKECDAVVYDRLASYELLEYVKPECVMIYAGKRAGYHDKKQDEINKILVECSKKYSKVVRLKGGDPFVFGRGGEEIEVLNQHDIEYEVVPGVTSAVAVPECAGIPVTHRGVSRSFHVVTGHTNTDDGLPECNYNILAEMEGTIVFLMGLGNLGKIASNLIKNGKASDTPVAVVSDGTTHNQCVVRGVLGDIEEKVKNSPINSPAIIVIGETAAYDYRYRGLYERKKIGLTATKVLRKRLEKCFSDAGADTYTMCDMDIVLNEDIDKLDNEMKCLDRYRWILFTSQNGVKLFFDRLKELSVDIRRLYNIKFAVLGSGTAAKLKEYRIIADFIPSEYTVSVLAKEFSNIVKCDERVLIPRAERGSKELLDIFDKNGVHYTDLSVYDVTGRLTDNIELMKQMDCLVFVSASGVKAFFEEIDKKNLRVPKNIKIACIGAVTCEAVRKKNICVDIIAATNNVEGLVEAVMKYF